MNNKTIKIVLISFMIYVLSGVTSYFAFSILAQSSGEYVVLADPEKSEDGKLSFDDSLPKTESCPLNGGKLSKQRRTWWEKHRPLGIMIENHEESRPQSGLYSADVVYEAVAEGGITRFLAIFYCQDAGTVGPVRSARTYYLDFISEYGNYPLYAHVGGANAPGPADALSQIEKYGWQAYNDLNQFSIGFPTFWRDYERLGHPVSTEHTMYSTTEKLWKEASKRGLTEIDKDKNKWDEDFDKYSFKEDEAEAAPTAQSISLNFWKGYEAYSVEWRYDKATNSYLRFNGGKEHLDFNNKKQLTAKNIIILFMTERTANDGYEGDIHLLYGTKGTGKAIVFIDGKRIDATWVKKDRTSRTKIIDLQGKEIKFNRGITWFDVLPTGNTVTVN